jgi:tripeptidyl-peptidase-1
VAVCQRPQRYSFVTVRRLDWFRDDCVSGEELFDAEFSTFVHDGSGKSVIRTLAYSIPASLKDHLDVVHPTITWVICPVLRTALREVLPFVCSFPSPRQIGLPVFSSPAKFVPAGSQTSAVAPLSCDQGMTPKCVQQLYGIPSTPASQPSNKLAVSGYIEQFANRADLKVCAEASNSIPKN